MIILTNTTDSVQVALAANVATSQLRCYSSYRDVTTNSITPLRGVTNSNNTTAVNIVASPASSTQRIVDYISIYNADTASSTVTVSLSDNGTLYTLTKSTLGAGERLEYQEGKGFSMASTSGSIKENTDSIGLPVSNSTSFAMISADVTNATTTIANITNLSFSVTAGKTYWFRFVIHFTTTIASNGIRLSISGPASPTFLVYESDYPLSTISITSNRGLTAYDSPAAANASTAALTGNVGIIQGIITPSSTGTLIGRFNSETAAGNSVTVKAGSFVLYQQLN